ncbi:hypothetical protein [Streptomyces pseudovenezuelae]|uniref:hypothetical protein n=1 Tax=Streptomyces pseudovenezuelae TaxID=67350 RepID=UPI0039A46B41
MDTRGLVGGGDVDTAHRRPGHGHGDEHGHHVKGISLSSLERITNVVPISATDLVDWAVRLYDAYLSRPDPIRPATWARLKRSPTGHLVADHDRKRPAIAEAALLVPAALA